MHQPKRGLANVILESGPDVSAIQEDLEFYSPPTAWSHPLLWGAFRGILKEKVEVPRLKSVQPALELGGIGRGNLESGNTGCYIFQPVNQAAYQAVNALLAENKTVYRMENSFADADRTFTPGSFIVTDQVVAEELNKDYGQVLSAISAVPDNAVLMKKQRIALIADAGAAWLLKTHGFDYDIITSTDINSGRISDYDVFMNANVSWPSLVLHEYGIANLREAGLPEDVLGGLETLVGLKFRDEGLLTEAVTEAAGGSAATLYSEQILAQAISWEHQQIKIEGREALFDFFEKGGDYIGLGLTGAEFAVEAGLTAAAFSVDWTPDAIIHVDYDTTSPLSGGFRDISYAYVLAPTIYFENVPEGATPAISIVVDDFLKSGYWPGWRDSPARGKPVVIHQKNGNTDVTLIGIETTYLAHPKNSFRVVANAIFTGLE